MPSKSRYPLESFGPEIMAALLRGATQTVRIPTTYRLGVQFRRRVHQLRGRMKEEGHPEYALAARTKVQLLFGPEAGLEPVPTRRGPGTRHILHPEDPSVPAVLVLSPHDSEFTSLLSKAGISADLSEEKPLVPEPRLHEADPLAAFEPKESGQ